ncbi:MAG: guanylate kinase [Nitrospinota bacterium]
MMPRRGRLLVISAPSGTGKSTLIGRACRELPGLWHSVSATTRPPRPGEEDGRHYHFLSREGFEEGTGRGELLEWARVYGDYYGTPRRPLEEKRESGTDILLDLDVQGARRVKELEPEATLIFLIPPSHAELERRIRSRQGEPEEVVERRLREAEEEMTHRGEYDHVIVNDDLERALEELKGLILARRTGEEGSP